MAYITVFSFKLICRLDALAYDKLLKISQYNNLSKRNNLLIFYLYKWKSQIKDYKMS